MSVPPLAVITDIEGTTTPIAFVRDILFPYARTRLPAFLHTHGDEPAVRAALDDIATLAPGVAPLDALVAWMDADAKLPPLKALQGMIWRQGYRDGALHGVLYPDVAPALRRWHAAGLRLNVYSSGSEESQRLLFTHAKEGNLAGLFGAFFDTRVGGKREAASYADIAAALGLPRCDILFLSDVEQELDAAAASGMATCQLVRAEDNTAASARHPWVRSFDAVPV